jgi:hypothetical protein
MSALRSYLVAILPAISLAWQAIAWLMLWSLVVLPDRQVMAINARGPEARGIAGAAFITAFQGSESYRSSMEPRKGSQESIKGIKSQRDKMNFMLRRLSFRIALSAAALCLAAGLFSAHAQETTKRGRKYKSPPPVARIEVSVLRDQNGKPIENAAVIFHTMKDAGNMELKSNEDGKAVIDVLPIGETVRLQIIAKGFQTYGQDYKIDKSELAIEVRMKRPGEQYSIYKDHPDDSKNDNQDKDKPKEGDKPSDKPTQPQSN